MSVAIKHAPAFDFYPERWLAGTMDLSDAEQLSYLRLLCHQWIMNGLPSDVATLKRLGGRGVTEKLLAKFPESEGKRWNARLEKERVAQRDRIKTRKVGAAISHMKRYGVESLTSDERELLMDAGKLAEQDLSKNAARLEQGGEQVAQALPPPTTHHPPPTPSLNTERERAREDAEWVERIVAAYPHQDSPLASRNAISACMLNGDDPEKIYEAVRECATLIRKAPGGTKNRFVPSAAKFFEAEQWRAPDLFEARWSRSSQQMPKPKAKLPTGF